MKDKKLIHVATFGQPQGLRGEIKINIHTSSLESFKSLNQFFLEDGISKIIFKSFKVVGKKNISFIEGCDDRDIAETHKGKKIFSMRENLPIINDDEYYVADLIGCKVINKEKKNLGKIIDIKNFGAGDLMEISKERNKIFFIPMNKDNLINIDLQKMIIVVDPILGLLN
jgi:16S rRNA processing protein RimM